MFPDLQYVGDHEVVDDRAAVVSSVCRASRADVDELAGVLGRAFAEDPIWLWVYRQEDRADRLARMFRALLRSTMDRGATVLTDEGRRGAAIWQPSDQRSLGLAGNLRTGMAMVRGRADMGKATAMMRATESRHPKERHWYLAVLGTHPEHQGEGIGTALMHEVLDDEANRELPAYLETETEANVSYYSRHGFEVIDETDVGHDGPHLWFMWRDAPVVE